MAFWTHRSLVIPVAGAVIIAIIMATVVPSIANQPSNSPLNREPKIAVVTDALFADKGWGGASQHAAEFVSSKYGYEVTSQDGIEIADIESTLRKYAEARYDLIIAHGVQW